jgi:hypothetical protein
LPTARSRTSATAARRRECHAKRPRRSSMHGHARLHRAPSGGGGSVALSGERFRPVPTPPGHPRSLRARPPVWPAALGPSGTLPQPASLSSAACEEDPSRLREASPRTSDPDLGSDLTWASPLVNVHPPSGERPVGKLVAKTLDLESLARPACVADGGPLVRHGVSTVPATAHSSSSGAIPENSGPDHRCFA